VPCLRAAGLALAACLVPACGDDVDGDTVSTVTVRVSVGRQEEQAHEDNLMPAISADGRYVAFASAATDLTENDSNGLIDIFVKDRLTGEVENITNRPFTFIGQADCEVPAISGNGRFVAFLSVGQFVNDPTFSNPSGYKMLYVFDRQDKVFRTPVATTPFPNANVGDDFTGSASLSALGRYMAFTTTATNIAGLTTGGVSQVVRCDWGPNFDTPVNSVVSHAEGAPGTAANGTSLMGRISGDGSRVAFMSQATNLAALQDADPGLDIYLWVLAAGPPVRLVSVVGPSAPTPVLSAWPSISFDGNFVAFHHFNSVALIPRTIQRYDVANDTTLPVSDPAHTPGSIDFTTISGDGRYVGYVAGNGGFVAHVWRYDAQTLSFEQLSQSSFGVSGNQTSSRVVFSANGLWSAWHTRASNLVAGDTNGVFDVFVRGPSSGF
jgi:Tol biopolymer transport system component